MAQIKASVVVLIAAIGLGASLYTYERTTPTPQDQTVILTDRLDRALELVVELDKTVRSMKLDASTYHDKYVGRRTANGEVYSHDKATVASNRHPLGTRVEIAYNGRTVEAKVNDRLSKKYSHRIDLSRSVWNELSDNAHPGILKGVEVTEKK